MVDVDISGAEAFFTKAGRDYADAAQAHRTLTDATGEGAEYTGWLQLPQKIKENELHQILNAAQKIRSRSGALVVIGIGGSYLGAKGAVELLQPVPGKGNPKIFFVGNGLSVDYINQVLDEVRDTDFDVNVISKSGTTLEPAVAFRIFRSLLKEKYGANARKHIIATTDASRGVLRTLASEENWESFVIPDDVGGRYSVLSAVGLLPMAVAGIDIKAVLGGAIEEFSSLDSRSPSNPAWKYAATRQHLYRQGRTIEFLASYEPSFRYMAEWWKQLFGESEGKGGIGIFPAYVEYSADLHSMGQYIQDGPRVLMETVVEFAASQTRLSVPFEMGNPDRLNYLAGWDMDDICKTAAKAVRNAHISGNVPNLRITVPQRNEEGLGALFAFFELSCAISAYMSGVNPFNQPGVEAYKRNMFRMLGKPIEPTGSRR